MATKLSAVRCAFLLFGALLLTGCERATDLRTTKMPIGNATFTLEIADNDATREHGLMQRDGMPDDHGMIFVFADETPRAFWMKNTRFPLDILYVDGRGSVVSVKTMQPYDLTGITSDGAAKYAIELNAKTAERVKIRAGDRLAIPPDARDTKQ